MTHIIKHYNINLLAYIISIFRNRLIDIRFVTYRLLKQPKNPQNSLFERFVVDSISQ